MYSCYIVFIHTMVPGVPPKLRGRVWTLLVKNYSSANNKSSHQFNVDLDDYKKLFHTPATRYLDIVTSDIGELTGLAILS